MSEHANSTPFSNEESSIEARFQDCKEGLKSLIASLQPYAPLDEIDVQRLDKMIEELKGYILLFNPVVNDMSPQLMDEDDIAFLEKACESVSTVYKSLVAAIGELRTARLAVKTINASIANKGTFNVTLQSDCFTCYDRCCQALVTAFTNMNV
ncbi:hypothetical protein EPA93_46050 [Ktedonosporobacter rubrisoli]|uniref:Uncharacterized protein n=1 Tax=Ktedonosporobacter rubrisoli TaxID=2509675 RepID=A0A4P6K3U0_KTERU|nr:hypothetical protein [Ktedonosporobacter rubrisoli]QBD82938.1 hypothetical protein EPA93_46050 [Ktedonosporobacter rubrisoli]